MSWNILPTETQQQVVDSCWQADQAYRARLRGEGGQFSKLQEWWGRSCSAMSLVSSSSRSIATVKVRKMLEPVFAQSILNSPLCTNITAVDFHAAYHLDRLQFALFHVLPRLLRLERINNLDMRATKILFGAKGIVEGRRLGRSQDVNAKVYAWRSFKTLALRIKHWELELDAEEVEALFDIDPSIKANVLSLSLSTPFENGFPILETDDSRFPEILSSLPSLVTLSISKARTLTGNAVVPSNPSISEDALSTSYRFTSTLTSFTWKGDSDGEDVKAELLQFLTRFESLRHLRLEAADLNSNGFSSLVKIRLPQLTDFEIIGGRLTDLDRLLDYLDLPNLIVLRLSPEYADAEDFVDLQTKQAENLYWRLFRFKDTLRHVYLGGFEGLYQLSLDQVITGSFYGKSVTPPYTVRVGWQPGAREAVTSDDLAEDPSVSYGITEEEILGGIVEGVKELNVWVGEELSRAEDGGDVAKAKQLLRAMKPVWELREWNKD